VPKTFRSKDSLNSFTSKATKPSLLGPVRSPPAEFINTSTFNSPIALFNISEQFDEVISITTGIILSPPSFTNSSKSVFLLAQAKTLYPSFANPKAAALPIPKLAPVTTTTLIFLPNSFALQSIS
jgi:hypothetical protein